MFIEIVNAATTAAEKTSNVTGSDAIANLASYIWDRVDNWFAAILVGLFVIFFAKFFRNIVVDRISSQVDDNHEDVILLAGRAAYAGTLSIGITVALKIAGIDITAIIAAVGFGIGFALQDLIMNFIAGVLILLNHPFKLGDFIKVNDTVGKVEDIQSRSTILKGVDGVRIVVPNSDLISNQITNFTTNPFRRIEIVASIDYNTDIEKAMKLCKAIVDNNPKVNKQPAPSLVIEEFGDYSIDIKIRFWVDSHSSWLNTKTEILRQIKEGFDKAGLNMPYPTQSVIVDKDESPATKQVKENPTEKEEELINSIEKSPDESNSGKTINPSDVRINSIELMSPSMEPQVLNITKPEDVSYIKQETVLPAVETHRDFKGSEFLSNTVHSDDGQV